MICEKINKRATPATFTRSAEPYRIRVDLQPVTLAASTPFLLLINPALPVKTVRELIAHAKEKPGQLNY